MEELKKLDATVTQLKAAIKKVEDAKAQAELNAADAEIGAALRSIQYGVGMVGIECKQAVEARRRTLSSEALGDRFGRLVDRPVPSKTQQRKESIVEKAKKAARKKKGSK